MQAFAKLTVHRPYKVTSLQTNMFWTFYSQTACSLYKLVLSRISIYNLTYQLGYYGWKSGVGAHNYHTRFILLY